MHLTIYSIVGSIKLISDLLLSEKFPSVDSSADRNRVNRIFMSLMQMIKYPVTEESNNT